MSKNRGISLLGRVAFGLSLCVGVASADPMYEYGPLAAGDFIFSDFHYGDEIPGFPVNQLGEPTITTGVASSGPYAGQSFISFNDDGVVGVPWGTYVFQYEVTYSGARVPTSYSVALVGGQYLYGTATQTFFVYPSNHSALLYPGNPPVEVTGGNENPYLPSTSFFSGVEFTYAGPTSITDLTTGPPESFTIYYAANLAPIPEPAYLALPGLLLVGYVAMKRRRQTKD